MTGSPWNRLPKVCVALIALVAFGITEKSFAQVTNTNVYYPADYTTFQPPAKGGSYTDAVFVTAIKRLTDSMTMIRADIGSGTLASISPEYSAMSPFNMDNTRLLLEHFAYFGLYDGSGNYLRDLLNVSASAEPRWSRTDPNIIYYVSGNQLKQMNVGTNTITILHTFSEYSSISGMGESDISVDGNHFVFAGDRHYVFVYEVSSQATSPVFDTGIRAFDSLYISPSNQVTITWANTGTSRYQGIELFDRNMSFLRQLTHAGGHMDIASDVNGDEVLLWTNSNDSTPIPNCNNGIVKVRLLDAKQTCLVQLDWSLAVHVSAPDNNGWVFVETYNPIDVIPPTGWKTYTNEFLEIKLDGTEVRRLAHHRSRPLNSYTYMPKISTSRDGTKLVFGSNFGLQAQLGYPTEYSDAYLMDLGRAAPATSLTTTTVASSRNPSVSGQNVTFTATVVPSSATGTVQFFDNGNLFASAPLSGGSASASTSSLSAGNHSVVATYGGDVNFSGSSGTFSQTVNSLLPGAFSITASPFSITPQKTTALDIITVTPSNGFTGPVTLTVSGLPPQATATFGPSAILVSSSAAGNSALTIALGKNALKRTFTLTIKGSGGGISSSTTVTLTVP